MEAKMAKLGNQESENNAEKNLVLTNNQVEYYKR